MSLGHVGAKEAAIGVEIEIDGLTKSFEGGSSGATSR